MNDAARNLYNALGDAMGPQGADLWINGKRVDSLAWDRRDDLITAEFYDESTAFIRTTAEDD